MEVKSKVKILILAAGKGTRMKTDLPKVLAPLKGKPMISWLLESITKSGVDPRPTLVVGYQKELVMKELGDGYEYVTQEEQLGTGHAVHTAEPVLKDTAENVIVFCGDNPYLKPETIKNLASTHLASGALLTIGTVKLPDFLDWRNFFYTDFSRIIRDEKGKIIKSVEFRDTTPEQKNILEVNPIYFCFNAAWLWNNLGKLKTENAQKEYYLTDLLEIATNEGIEIASINIEPEEASAANSKEELEMLEKMEAL